uniref:Uncharacterized protein AlNc14C115G6501 n=1 Tax=Albugo laibachii Nc14 TaxID=890382 RepID=F0WIW4_9STRA|nr:conserved hypothetical protein [Albugo laibachii Nc14]|eukprot:CCA21210.1 conserved hypothetical protein [Albugo laibachii Nc14]
MHSFASTSRLLTETLDETVTDKDKETEDPASLFQIGDKLEVWRVMLMLFVLVFVVVAIEQSMHFVESKAGPYPKYHEMLRKIYRELMILGLISICIKFICEMGIFQEENHNLLAFEAADLTVFNVALILIVQAIRIFFWLRTANHRMDRDEIFTAQDILDIAKDQSAWQQPGSKVAELRSWCQNRILCRRSPLNAFTPARFRQIIQMRTLRHFFLRTYGLPELFPFAKYLKRVQDNQISHLIEVELSTWVLFMVLLFVVDVGARELQIVDHESECNAIMNAFSFLTLVLLGAHIIVLQYLKFSLRQINLAAGYTSVENSRQWLQELAKIEHRHHHAEKVATNVIEAMQHVEGEQEARYMNQPNFWNASVWTLLRLHCCKRKEFKKGSAHEILVTIDSDDLPPRPELIIKYFQPGLWHYVVKMLLMINGFFCALFFQLILHQLVKKYRSIGLTELLGPLPLVINMLFIQPSMFRHLVLVSSVFQVDVVTLNQVTTEFSEMVSARAEFVSTLRHCLQESNRSITDIQHAFQQMDPEQTGIISISNLRHTLNSIGLHYTTLCFNRLAKVLFRVRKDQVEYLIIERLLRLVQDREDEYAVSAREIASDHLLKSRRFHDCVIAEEEEDRVSRCLSIRQSSRRQSSQFLDPTRPTLNIWDSDRSILRRSRVSIDCYIHNFALESPQSSYNPILQSTRFKVIKQPTQSIQFSPMCS